MLMILKQMNNFHLLKSKYRYASYKDRSKVPCTFSLIAPYEDRTKIKTF